MQSVLEEQRLLQLQQEGGASLAWLRSAAAGEEQRGALEKVSTLYNQVDELLHSLVALSNRRSQELSFIQDFSRLEQHFTEVRQQPAWLWACCTHTPHTVVPVCVCVFRSLCGCSRLVRFSFRRLKNMKIL